MESVARVFGDPGFAIDPALAAALHVGGFEIFARERLPCFEQFDDGFGELSAGGPGFVDAGTGENVGGAGTFADAGIPLPARNGSPCASGFLQRLRAPRAERAALEMLPYIRMLDVMLQVAIGGAQGLASHDGNEDADGGEAIGMNVEEAEDFGFGIAEGVEDGARLEFVCPREVR